MNTDQQSSLDITLSQAAELLGVSEQTVRRYIKQGKLSRRYTHHKHGAQLILARTEVEQLRDDDQNVIGVITTAITHQPSRLNTDQITLSTLLNSYQQTLEGYQQALSLQQNSSADTHEVLARLEAGQKRIIERLEDLEAENTRLRVALEEAEQPRSWWQRWRRG